MKKTKNMLGWSNMEPQSHCGGAKLFWGDTLMLVFFFFFFSWVLFKTLAAAKLGQKWSPVRPSSNLLQPWGCTASTNCRIFPACWLNLPARQELTLSNMATRLLTAAHDLCFSTQPFVRYTTYTDDTVVFAAECRHWTSSRSREIGGVTSAKPQA